jgi:hydrogenase nickel incorporation protein HypA/HybF
MHELSLCQSLLRVVDQQAAQHQAARVHKVWLEIGELVGVEAELIQFCFPIAAKNSKASNAELKIISLPGRAWCETCQTEVNLSSRIDPCPCCQGYHYKITQGQEIRIKKIEIH